MFIDSHTHLYLEEFDSDRKEVIHRALEKKVLKLLLPNIDYSTTGKMLEMCREYQDICYPMLGLHPGSVKEDFQKELRALKKLFKSEKFYAIGEVGIDLYWDTTYKDQQKKAFRIQIEWAKQQDLPLVIHARDSFSEIFEILDHEMDSNLKGVFHSFTGGECEIEKIKEYDFFFGINGIISFKNNNLKNVIKKIPLERLLLETDSPYLSPVPNRGKRNESSNLPYIADAIAKLLDMDRRDIESISRENTEKLFKLK